MTNAVVVNKLGKRFRLYHKGRPTTLQETLVRGLKGIKPEKVKWALRDVNFSVPNGTMLGILGHNGAGKSTLLRLLGGVLKPDEGEVLINGRIGGLLELGAGFHPDLTGRENIFINGVVAGLTRAQVAEQFDEILAFSELEADIDYPLRTYSSGMKMRLGFAIAVYTDPDILLIDEVLAVGDLAFRQKCFERINKIKAQGKTIVLVTHDVGQVENLCDQALWLANGEVQKYGAPSQVVPAYRAAMLSETLAPKIEGHSQTVVSPIKLLGVRLLDAKQTPLKQLQSGADLAVEISYEVTQKTADVIFSFSIYNEEDQLCCRLNTANAQHEWPPLQNNGRIIAHLETLQLVQGAYYLDVGVFNHDWSQSYAWQKKAAHFKVKSPHGRKLGILAPSHRWELQTERPFEEIK